MRVVLRERPRATIHRGTLWSRTSRYTIERIRKAIPISLTGNTREHGMVSLDAVSWLSSTDGNRSILSREAILLLPTSV